MYCTQRSKIWWNTLCSFFYNLFNIKYKYPNNNVRSETPHHRHQPGITFPHTNTIMTTFMMKSPPNQCIRYILVTLVSSSRRLQTCRVVCDRWRADILKRRSISTQLNFRGSVVVSTPAYNAADRGSNPVRTRSDYYLSFSVFRMRH